MPDPYEYMTPAHQEELARLTAEIHQSVDDHLDAMFGYRRCEPMFPLALDLAFEKLRNTAFSSLFSKATKSMREKKKH